MTTFSSVVTALVRMGSPPFLPCFIIFLGRLCRESSLQRFEQNGRSSISNDVAMLAGRRFATAIETGPTILTISLSPQNKSTLPEGSPAPMQKAPVTPKAKPKHLKSWKEIAVYLGRGVRTVQRWEKMGLPVQRPKSDSRGSVTAATDDIDNWISGAHTHGFNVPQIGERQPFREGLLDSVQKARALRNEMAILRENQHIAMTQLKDKITALEKSCGNTLPEAKSKKSGYSGGRKF